MVLEFKIGPRDLCRVTATPPWTLEWQGQDAIVEHSGKRLIFTVPGRMAIVVKSPGYKRVYSEMAGSFLTVGFDVDPVLAGVSEAVEPMKEVKAVPKGPDLPAPTAEIARALVDLGYYDFEMPLAEVQRLSDENAFGKALAPWNVVLGQVEPGRWRLTMA